MSILIYTENWDGKFKKVSFELASYAAALAEQTGKQAIAVSLGEVENSELEKLGQYGIGKIVTAQDKRFATLDNKAITKAIAAAAKQVQAEVIILSHDNLGKAIAPRLAIRCNAGLVTAVTGLPESLNPFIVHKNVFTGKAIAHIKIEKEVKVLTLAYNSFGLNEKHSSVEITSFDPDLTDSDFSMEVLDTTKVTGKVLLNEADIVVSGGRGMKSADNWYLIEELAEELGAATACSRPVSDEGWRPHDEHVGQTGKIISPNLYFAFGISGAIQHLGGVSSSKVIVAVNKDPEAPIFEAADYGITGDALKVLPELIQAVKDTKNQ
ncbi:MAG: electron transfer flavoprotein subunit alpha/FixB family protein [Bacteroidales bacterium]|nr:electron transfer flavoprotein subunit alpha/FixB family protein [Bacteroidales bacterium]